MILMLFHEQRQCQDVHKDMQILQIMQDIRVLV